MKGVLLTGANGVVGHPLSQHLQNAGITYFSVSRNHQTPDHLNSQTTNVIQWDLRNSIELNLIDQLKLANVDTLIHCSPIWLLPSHLHDLLAIGVRRIIAFSSSSLMSKRNSNDTSDGVLVQQLSSAEEALKEFCDTQSIGLTIFRPSMIYGYGIDQNITHVAKFIKRYGFMVLTGKAHGLRQPVHADDLVKATFAVLDNSQTVGKTYVLAGATTLSYRDMVEAIFEGLNKRPKIISIPLVLFRLALKIAALMGRFSYTPEMANRMNQNLNYDISDANKDFSFSPQEFLSEPTRDLP